MVGALATRPDPLPAGVVAPRLSGVESPLVVVGLVAAPGAATELAASLVGDLEPPAAALAPGVRWEFRLVTDRLVDPPATLSDVVGAGRRRLLAEGWHLSICLTDLPLRTQRRPVVAHASPSHGVAVVSLPALGAIGVRRRAADTVVRLAVGLLGEDDPEDRERPARQLVDRVSPGRRGQRRGGADMVARVAFGNVRLLLGMLRANKPWRLAARLSRVLVAVFGAGAFALVTSDIWKLSASLRGWQLSAVAVGSVLATGLTLIVGADLWERSPHPAAREQIILFNLVTTLTVVIGVLALYLALFVLTLTATFLLVPDGPFGAVIGHPVGLPDRLYLAWLSGSVATIGGALGAGLETDEAVREAAYSYHPDEHLT